MLLVPGMIFLLTLPVSSRLRPGLRAAYRFIGGFVVFVGSGISLYLASYTGDQGGIAAFFFQIAVILVYATVTIVIVVLNQFSSVNGSGNSDSRGD
ncbi:MAG: hypothetical protein ACR2RD_05985 [Woeseiaceae bacterium]